MSAYQIAIYESALQAYRAGQLGEAEALLKLLLGSGWNDAHVSYFIGHLAFVQGEAEAAANYLGAATQMDPRHARAHNDFGEALRALGRHEEAEAILRRSIELEPTLAYPYGNLGAVLHALNRDEEALPLLEQSLRVAVDRAVAHCDLGVTLAWLQRHEEAIEQYRLAQSVQPDFPRARYSESLSMLALGDFDGGWVKHEARLRDPTNAKARRISTEPAWHGEDIAGRTILLHAEQGHGDSLQFIRYLPYVAAKGATILLQCPAALHPLFAGMGGVSAFFAPKEDLPSFDLQCSLMSLAYALRDELDGIPATVPYLTVDPVHVAHWGGQLGPRRRMRIGISWSGNPVHPNDRNRSVRLATLARLLSRPDIDFHVLQTDVRDVDRDALAELRLHDHSASLHDFADTAALALQMDLLITVDSALAHLGGALAVPTWVMLPWATDWRWLLDRADSPWYPTLQLFRQTQKGDWSSVLTDIARALDRWT